MHTKPSPATLWGLRAAGLVAVVAAGLPIVLATGTPPGPRLGALAAFAVFVAAFLLGTLPRAAESLGPLLLSLQAVAAVVAADLFPSTATLVLAVVLAAQFPFHVRAGAGLAGVALLTAAIAVIWREAPAGEILMIVGTFGGFMLFAFFTGTLVEKEATARRQLAAAHAELTSERVLAANRIRLAERDRIAADLHDAIGHDLVALRVNLQAATRHEGDVAREHLARSAELAGLVLGDLRDLVAATRADRAVPLGVAVARIAASVPRPRIDLDVEADLRVSDGEVAEAALRCVQEAVSNAIRHAGAERVWIEVRREEARLCVLVRDDGRGAAGKQAGGTGLAGLSARVVGLGGTFHAGADPAGGFVVRAEFPLPRSRR